MRIVICDDDKMICSQLENILLQHAEKSANDIQVSVFFSGESLLEYINHGNFFDLIYIDIKMQNINGIEVGKYIRKTLKDYATELIYISGYDTYDRQLFDVQPLHFIPKPISESMVLDDLQLALERIGKRTIYFHYQKGHDVYRVPVHEILYFENASREIKIYMVDHSDSFYGTFDEIALRLSGQSFIQIHRSYLMNYNHVNILRYAEVVMSNGAVLPISRAKRKEFRNLQFFDF